MKAKALSKPLPALVPPRLRWGRLAALTLLGFLAGLGLAWLATAAQRYYAPLVLFPLMLGFALGLALVVLLQLTNSAHRMTVWAALLLAVIGAVGGQHYFSYRAARAAALANLHKAEVARSFPDLTGRLPAVPQGLMDYLRAEAVAGRPMPLGLRARGAWAGASWAVDGLLLGCAAAAAVGLALRRPYCGRCESWFRTTRQGLIPPAIVPRVAGQGGIRKAEYRLRACRAGCAPVLLELAWRTDDGVTGRVEQWLSPPERDRLTAWLDADVQGDARDA